MRFTVQRIDDGHGPYRKIPVVLHEGQLCGASIYEARPDDLTDEQAAELMGLCVEYGWTFEACE